MRILSVWILFYLYLYLVRHAIEVLNESIDVEHKIRYIALDYR